MIGPNSTIQMEFRMSADGTPVASSTGKEPLEFTIGQGEMIAGLEKALIGMNEGEEKTITLDPEDAFGEYDPDAVQKFPRSAFGDDQEFVKGNHLVLTSPDTKEEVEAKITQVTPNEVTLDFNHPFAGKTLQFDVKIIRVS
jgi:FKBP-type peptidyl-prolyl cis-trans isomerase 2